MKNMKVSLKLVTSFLIVLVMTIIVGVVGVIGMSQINTASENMFEMQTKPMPNMTKIVEVLQRQRAIMREYIIASATGDMDLLDDARARSDARRIEFYENLELYAASIDMTNPASEEAIRLMDEAVYLYENSVMHANEALYQGARNGDDPIALYEYMSLYTADVNKMVDNFDELLAIKIGSATINHDSNNALFISMVTIIVIVVAVACAIALFFAFYIASLIAKPIGALSDFMKKAGTTGDLTLSPQDVAVIEKFAEARDEIGHAIGNASAFVNHVTTISQALEAIATGDLTGDVNVLSDVDTMGQSLKNMIANLNNMFSNIQSSTTQVSTGAKQVADGAQSLAQGSTEQAASVEQLSASIGEIAESTKTNADTASKAAKLSGAIKDNAEKGSHQMDEMITAVKDINDASQSISTIIKTIDNIAFQTNILALNAAVEAARAGQHGKGFAVVAEEVRNLASQSAEAAKDTGTMIQNSMDKAELGTKIAGETATSLKEIVEGISESTELIQEIAKSSEAQSLGITQINTGIDQVAHVVQQNSATAEESAAASEEMSSQSTMLEELISQFKLKDSASGARSLPSSHRVASENPIPDDMPTLNEFPLNGDDSFGKY